MDKTEWKEVWHRVLPRLTFGDVCKIAEDRKVRPKNGVRLDKLDPDSFEDYRAIIESLEQDLLNQKKNKKLFLSWLNPYRDDTISSHYDAVRITAFLQDGDDDIYEKWQVLAALLLTRLPELQAIASEYIRSLPQEDEEEIRKKAIVSLRNRICAAEKTNKSLQQKLKALETSASRDARRLKESLDQQNHLRQKYENLKKENEALQKDGEALRRKLQKGTDRQEDIRRRLESAWSRGRVFWIRKQPHPFEESIPSLAVHAFQFGRYTERDYQAIGQYLKENGIHEILADPLVIPHGDILLMRKIIRKQGLPVVIVTQSEEETLAIVKEL